MPPRAKEAPDLLWHSPTKLLAFPLGAQSRYIHSWAGCNCLVTTVVCVLRTSQWTVLCKGDPWAWRRHSMPIGTRVSGSGLADTVMHTLFVCLVLFCELSLQDCSFSKEQAPHRRYGGSCLAWLFPAGLTGVYYVDQATFEFRDLPALVSRSVSPPPPVH